MLQTYEDFETISYPPIYKIIQISTTLLIYKSQMQHTQECDKVLIKKHYI